MNDRSTHLHLPQESDDLFVKSIGRPELLMSSNHPSKIPFEFDP